MGEGTNGIETGSYSVISYPANSYPKEYEAFVYAKWLRSLRYGNEYFKLIDSDAFFAAYKRYIATLLARDGATLRFASLSDSPDVLLGFSLTQRNTLHYLFVQYEHRNQGIAKALVPKGIQTITHLTKAGSGFWHSQLPTAKFDPFT